MGMVTSAKGLLKNMSLYRKLIVSYFMLILLPLAFVGTFAYSIVSSSIKSEVSRYTSEVFQQVNDNIDKSLGELDRMTTLLSIDPDVLRILHKSKDRPAREIVTDDDTMSEKINLVTNMYTNMEGFFVFSYNGEVYRSTRIANSIRQDYIFTRSRWFNSMRKLNQKSLLIPTHIQDDVIVEGHPKKVFSYIREVVDVDSRKPVGYILIDMNTHIFRRILDNLNIREYQELLVIDNNKTILYHTREENISTQFRSHYISKLLKIKKGTMMETVNGKPVLITFNTSAVTNWTVISIIPIDILYNKVKYLEYIIALTVFYCMLLAFLAAVMISRNITKPISNLRALMKKAETGQFNLQVPVETRDEIGELSLSFNSMITKTNNLIQTVYETKILKREAELNALQSQINPHFLYNTLQIMDIIAEKEGIDVISSVCRSLSRIFRYSINRGREIVPLASEIEHVKNYIYIQKLRFKDKFDVTYDIDEHLLGNKIIKLVLQPLVENALFHGIENKRGKCDIIISAKQIDNRMELTVEDTGVGMDEYQLESLRRTINEEILHAEVDGLSQRSIGIKNVNARIRLYFGEEYGVTLDSEPNVGTRIRVTLPALAHEVKDNEHEA